MPFVAGLWPWREVAVIMAMDACTQTAMKEPFELVHLNRYRLSCRPDPTPEGLFLARVLISWISDDGEVVQHRLRPELPSFAIDGDAARAARDAAVRWLDERDTGRMGLAATSSGFSTSRVSRRLSAGRDQAAPVGLSTSSASCKPRGIDAPGMPSEHRPLCRSCGDIAQHHEDRS